MPRRVARSSYISRNNNYQDARVHATERASAAGARERRLNDSAAETRVEFTRAE